MSNPKVAAAEAAALANPTHSPTLIEYAKALLAAGEPSGVFASHYVNDPKPHLVASDKAERLLSAYRGTWYSDAIQMDTWWVLGLLWEVDVHAATADELRQLLESTPACVLDVLGVNGCVDQLPAATHGLTLPDLTYLRLGHILDERPAGRLTSPIDLAVFPALTHLEVGIADARLTGPAPKLTRLTMRGAQPHVIDWLAQAKPALTHVQWDLRGPDVMESFERFCALDLPLDHVILTPTSKAQAKWAQALLSAKWLQRPLILALHGAIQKGANKALLKGIESLHAVTQFGITPDATSADQIALLEDFQSRGVRTFRSAFAWHHDRRFAQQVNPASPPEPRRAATPSPRNPTLERAFREATRSSAEDVAARKAYADWLTTQGDPLGEVISAGLVRTQYARMAWRQIAPRKTILHPVLEDCSPLLVNHLWWYNVLYEVRIAARDKSRVTPRDQIEQKRPRTAYAILDALTTQPEARFTQRLAIEGFRSGPNWDRLMASIRSWNPPLTHLSIGMDPLCDLAAHKQKGHAQGFRPLSSIPCTATLKHVQIRATVTSEGLAALAQCAELETLRLILPGAAWPIPAKERDENAGVVFELATLLAYNTWPKLTWLSVHCSAIGADLIDAVAPWSAQLEHVSLSCALDPESVEAKADTLNASDRVTVVALDPQYGLPGPYEEVEQAHRKWAFRRRAHGWDGRVAIAQRLRTPALQTAWETQDIADRDWWHAKSPDPAGAGLRVITEGAHGLPECWTRHRACVRHGRHTVFHAHGRDDLRYWFGQRHGEQRLMSSEHIIEQTCELGLVTHFRIYELDGFLIQTAELVDGDYVFQHFVRPAASGEQHTLGPAFAGHSTDALEVTRSVRVASSGLLDHSTLEAWFRITPQSVHRGDAERLLAATDDKAFTQYTCTVKSDHSTVDIVTAHFGDTLVGVVLKDGQFIAQIDDSEIRAPTR